jgi:hypothetical protein
MGTPCQIIYMDEPGADPRGFLEAAIQWVGGFEEK